MILARKLPPQGPGFPFPGKVRARNSFMWVGMMTGFYCFQLLGEPMLAVLVMVAIWISTMGGWMM